MQQYIGECDCFLCKVPVTTDRVIFYKLYIKHYRDAYTNRSVHVVDLESHLLNRNPRINNKLLSGADIWSKLVWSFPLVRTNRNRPNRWKIALDYFAGITLSQRNIVRSTGQILCYNEVLVCPFLFYEDKTNNSLHFPQMRTACTKLSGIFKV